MTKKLKTNNKKKQRRIFVRSILRYESEKISIESYEPRVPESNGSGYFSEFALFINFAYQEWAVFHRKFKITVSFERRFSRPLRVEYS